MDTFHDERSSIIDDIRSDYIIQTLLYSTPPRHPRSSSSPPLEPPSHLSPH